MTFPLYVYGAVKQGDPAQVNVIGTTCSPSACAPRSPRRLAGPGSKRDTKRLTQDRAAAVAHYSTIGESAPDPLQFLVNIFPKLAKTPSDLRGHIFRSFDGPAASCLTEPLIQGRDQGEASKMRTRPGARSAPCRQHHHQGGVGWLLDLGSASTGCSYRSGWFAWREHGDLVDLPRYRRNPD